MLNYFTLLFILLTFNNIILLNEETLILLCFIVFSWLFNKNLGILLKNDLSDRSTKIKNLLKTSLKEVSISLNTAINTKHRFWDLFYNFERLTKHYLKFTYIVIDWLNDRNFKSTQSTFLKHLQFVSRIEIHTSKLLSLILIKKLKNVVLLKSFYSTKLENPYFTCSHKINVRQCIRFVKFS
uniref:ATP synthase F0 subunit 4 n=1 Tax=Batrachospermum sp. TaxID=31373 RepID=UPI001FA76CA4|nr:ATP synthase F0 subunit 4 [Batrachospermum sp.]UNB13410.1 ATP synthase F0 subunit 4 [Batrachospermum sp.]